MKFTDGYWQTRPGVIPYFPAQVHEAEIEPETLTIFAPIRKLSGRWTNFITGQEINSPAWVRDNHNFLSLPLLVRPNSVIPVGKHAERPDYDYSDGVTLHIYALEDGQQITVAIPAPTGGVAARFEVQSSENVIAVKRNGGLQTGKYCWSALIPST